LRGEGYKILLLNGANASFVFEGYYFFASDHPRCLSLLYELSGQYQTFATTIRMEKIARLCHSYLSDFPESTITQAGLVRPPGLATILLLEVAAKSIEFASV
jgi:hypothetical protein